MILDPQRVKALKELKSRREQKALTQSMAEVLGEDYVRRTLCAIVARLCAASMSKWTSVPELAPCDRLDAAAALLGLVMDVCTTYGMDVPPEIYRHRLAVDVDVHEVVELLHNWSTKLYAR
ncbi:MAG: hypothetical protein U0836_20635 [Pirellulales bacterium]